MLYKLHLQITFTSYKLKLYYSKGGVLSLNNTYNLFIVK